MNFLKHHMGTTTYKKSIYIASYELSRRQKYIQDIFDAFPSSLTWKEQYSAFAKEWNKHNPTYPIPISTAGGESVFHVYRACARPRNDTIAATMLEGILGIKFQNKTVGVIEPVQQAVIDIVTEKDSSGDTEELTPLQSSSFSRLELYWSENEFDLVKGCCPKGDEVVIADDGSIRLGQGYSKRISGFSDVQKEALYEMIEGYNTTIK